jgi:hypothetical protein
MMKSSVILSGTDPPPFEVVAGGEVFAVGAQYDHRHVAVLGGAGPRRVELVEELDVLRVGDLGPIERDGRDAVGDLVFDVQQTVPSNCGAGLGAAGGDDVALVLGGIAAHPFFGKASINAGMRILFSS